MLKTRSAPTVAKGGCPAEKDNGGCYFIEKGEVTLRPNEIITVNKEFCDCEFLWKTEDGTNGKGAGRSAGRSVPLFFEECKNVYPDKEFSFKMRHASSVNESQAHIKWNSKDKVELLGKPL